MAYEQSKVEVGNFSISIKHMLYYQCIQGVGFIINIIGSNGMDEAQMRKFCISGDYYLSFSACMGHTSIMVSKKRKIAFCEL